MSASIKTSSILTNFSICDQAAHNMATAAIQQAKSLGLNICVCVLDQAGRIKHFRAMDLAPAVSYETSIKKAKTALGFGIPTGQTWYDFIKEDPILNIGAHQLPDFILLGGGSPITHSGQVIGAIGISGGHYKQDEQCVAAALQTLG
jgi:uncharacterized protein GlcG (DUF336 family)